MRRGVFLKRARLNPAHLLCAGLVVVLARGRRCCLARRFAVCDANTRLEVVRESEQGTGMYKLGMICLLTVSCLYSLACRSVPVESPVVDSAAPAVQAPAAAVAPTPAVAVPEVVEASAQQATVTDVRIVLHTSEGAIHATLFARKAPLTVANFLNLARRGYYDGLSFHRVIPNFMIQGGDPTGTGAGGPGYQFEDELDPSLRHNRAGILSMANSGPGTNGSQFFITHTQTPWLDGRHSVFGVVTQGQAVVDAIRRGATIRSVEVLDATAPLFREQQARIRRWNAVLEAKGF